MSSNIKIQKVCEWCGKEFTAQKTTTKYCCHTCNSRAYKEAARIKRIQNINTITINTIKEKPTLAIKDKQFLSFAETGVLLGITRQAIYKMVKSGHLKASKISSRLSFIKRSDIENMLDNMPYKFGLSKEASSITEFYATAEIKEKYNVNESWIFVLAKKNNIPKTFNRGKTYWSKKHIDNYFAKIAPNPDITEWYTVQEIHNKFNMTLAAVYTLASKDGIPKKKDGKNVYYSKKHFDIAKGISMPDEPQYYMVAEAMEKFNLTRDQLYHYVKFNNIPRVKVGKYTKISKPELDKLFAAPIIGVITEKR